jgi:hypothetical protein
MDITKYTVLLFGTTDIPSVLVGFLWACVGIYLCLQDEANKRDVSNPRTPIQFSYTFLTRDNANRILRSVVIVLVFMRFSQELLGMKYTIYISFFYGLISDKLSAAIGSFRSSLPFPKITVPSALVKTAIEIEKAPEDASVQVKKTTAVSTGSGQSVEQTVITTKNDAS